MTIDEEVEVKVIEKLKAVTDQDALVDNKNSDLKNDLGMTALLIQAMSVPYSKISLSYPGGVRVTIANAGRCKTVGDSIKLVCRCAKGDGE